MLKQGLAQVLMGADAQLLMTYHLGGGSDSDRKAGARWLQPMFGDVDARQLVVCPGIHISERSEEHTSELQSRQYLVCRLLLEKKKKNRRASNLNTNHPKISNAPFSLKKKKKNRTIHNNTLQINFSLESKIT